MKNCFLFIFAILITLSSCKFKNSTIMSNSSGRCGEVLLVMNDNQWEGKIGDTVAAWLAQEVLVLPQYEPTFKIIRIKRSAYNEIFRKARNVIFTDINPELTRSEFSVESNKFASPQVFITLRAPNDSAFYQAWLNTQQYILDTLVIAEQQRFLYGFNNYRNIVAEENMRTKHGVDMLIPASGFNVDMDSTHFVWISKETPQSSQGILVFDYPYRGPQDFDLQNMIRRIDSVLMLNVSGETQGTYMAIEKRLPPIQYQKSRAKNYMCELRGLWELEGDFMGGPFVSQSIVDTVNHRLVTEFAYVYGGKNDKKSLLWQLEAILSTFKIYYGDEDKTKAK